MPKRIKPEGEELEAWCRLWDSATHNEKMDLADEYGVSYDTTKHWRSESTNVVPRLQREEEPRMQVTVDELLAMRPAVNLDFVFFDLESSNLKADYSILLSAAIKPFGRPSVVFRSDDYPSWMENRADDKAITIDIANELKKHAIIVTHYGDRFDMPFLRAKMLHHGVEPLPQMFGVDTWKIARNNFQISSRRLKNLARYFDIGEKEQVEGDLWMAAAYSGSREAMDRIVAHNIRDVEVLEKLGCLTFPYLRSIPKL